MQRQQMKACMNILVMVQGLQGGRQMEISNSNSSTMEVPATISLCKNVLVVRRPPFLALKKMMWPAHACEVSWGLMHNSLWMMHHAALHSA